MADLVLPRGKWKVLQADDKDYKRGLLVKLLEDGGYKMAYWYNKPNKPMPVEIIVDGESITKDGKVVEMKFHPKDYYDKQEESTMKLEELVGKPITEAQFDEAAGKKDACYHKVKARYDVWPSAYASGALVKCRKVGAKNWGNKSKKEGLDDLKALPKDLKKSIKKNREESVNEAGMEMNKLKDAIKMFQKKIEKQGRVTNARDEEHLSNLIKLYVKMGGKGIKESFGGILRNLAKHAAKKRMHQGIKARQKAAAKRRRDKGGRFEDINEARGTCWVGYQQVGMKKKNGKMVPNCVKEIIEVYYEENGEGHGYTLEHTKDLSLTEAEYQGRKVKLGKIMQGDQKKFKVYVKNPKGNVVKVNFGQGGDAKGGTMRIRKSNPKARKAFRARHNCDNPGPRHKARYWSCRKW
tara:strand:- start:1167 stop:2393 length:1227 start_codon:yes stop_codon:yes gene_type:complete